MKSAGANPKRPFPVGLFLHWIRVYLPAWILIGIVISIVQTVLAAVLHEREDVKMFLKVLDNLPSIFKAFIGGDDLMASNVKSIVAIGYQHPLILTMLMINAVLVPSGLLTAQAEHGTMELLLARPLTRTKLYAAVVLAALGSQIILAGLVFLGTAVWTRYFDYGELIPLKGFAFVGLNLAALSVTAASVSTLASAWAGERTIAVGIMVAYFVGSYLLDFAAVWLPSLKRLHPWTLYNYCKPNAVLMADALPTRDLAILVTITVVSLVCGWWVWRRRDIHAA